MGFKCGIVGLPNVRKSTLFNALTESNKAEVANYPFSTIEPNIGRVPVPDKRLKKLSEISGSKKTIPTYMDFVDIAGLVKGASTGEGLGNKFLAHIREMDVIAHVVNCFENMSITHVSPSIKPIEDVETIETELRLADIETLQNKINTLQKKSKSGDKKTKIQLSLSIALLERLNNFQTLISKDRSIEELHMINELNLKEDFLNHEIICIENQPALKNPVMKTVQMILYSYFMIEGATKDKPVEHVHMINARNKLKVYKGPPVECKYTEKYKKNKYLSTEYTKLMILKEGVAQEFIDLFTESKKKDDLADAYLQGIYFIEK